VRRYKPVKPKSDQPVRMRHAVALREEGLSQRQIAAKQGVSQSTVRRDLAIWDAAQAKVSHLPESKMPPGGGNDSGGGGGNDSLSAVILPLRRSS
jgi:predicted DNA-binding protein (UPF0251 family)